MLTKNIFGILQNVVVRCDHDVLAYPQPNLSKMEGYIHVIMSTTFAVGTGPNESGWINLFIYIDNISPIS